MRGPQGLALTETTSSGGRCDVGPGTPAPREDMAAVVAVALDTSQQAGAGLLQPAGAEDLAGIPGGLR